MTTPELERAVVELINPRLNAVVPNISWGLGLRHEADLLVLDKQNRFTEIELKISKSDLKADFKKGHGHYSNFISRLVYAVPVELLDLAEELVPKHCGIIVADWRSKYVFGLDSPVDYVAAWWHRIPRHDPSKRPNEKQIMKFLRLGTIRIWNNTRIK